MTGDQRYSVFPAIHDPRSALIINSFLNINHASSCAYAVNDGFGGPRRNCLGLSAHLSRDFRRIFRSRGLATSGVLLCPMHGLSLMCIHCALRTIANVIRRLDACYLGLARCQRQCKDLTIHGTVAATE